MTIAELLKRIVDSATKVCGDLEPKFRHARDNVTAPEELRELWSFCDGQEPDAMPFLPDQMRLVSVAESNEIKAQQLRHDERADMVGYFSADWIPFSDNGGGECCVLDACSGHVLSFGCHGEPADILAKSINEWLSHWLSAFANGRIELDDGVFYVCSQKRWFEFWK